MFIQTEATPNPATLKFLPGRTLNIDGSAYFPNLESAANSPLAKRLFAVSKVCGVFFGSDFITVTKDSGEWSDIKTSIMAAIVDHFASGELVVTASEVSDISVQVIDDEIVTHIKELLDSRVRPAVAQDGGDIVFHSFRDGIVYLHMQGACSGCPSSSATLKSGVENMLRHYIPEVIEVQAI